MSATAPKHSIAGRPGFVATLHLPRSPSCSTWLPTSPTGQRRTWTVFVPFRSLPRHRQKMPEQWREPTDAHSCAGGARTRGDSQAQRRLRHRRRGSGSVAAVEQVSDLIESLSAYALRSGCPASQVSSPKTMLWSLARGTRVFPRSTEAAGRYPLPASPECALRRVRSRSRGTPAVCHRSGGTARNRRTRRSDCRWLGGHRSCSRAADVANVDAAADLASLVACSFPRAELTPLAYAYVAENDGQLAADLRAAQSNRSKCRLLADAIADGSDLAFAQNSDRAALMRMRGLLSDPRAVLGRVSGYVEEAVRRLYRQRNLVLHAGRTDSVAMTAYSPNDSPTCWCRARPTGARSTDLAGLRRGPARGRSSHGN